MWKRGFDASLAKELVESHEQLQQSLRDRSEIVRVPSRLDLVDRVETGTRQERPSGP